MERTLDWPELLTHPAPSAHIVQLYQDEAFLVESVAAYIRAGLRLGEAALVIVIRERAAALREELARAGVRPGPALKVLDAHDMLTRCMPGGILQWQAFHETIGGAVTELRRQYPAVRVHGEMVDLLWRRGGRDAALRLEAFWNELRRRQTFALLCAYGMDNLDGEAYGALESVCEAHTHLIPVRDYERFDDAVDSASRAVLDHPLAQMLLSLSSAQRRATQMPCGQATLLWLKQNMPRTADKVLGEVRARYGAEAPLVTPGSRSSTSPAGPGG